MEGPLEYVGTSLKGRRIAFFTSVVGMGGSEVLVADAVLAALTEGAAVTCWCHPDAAVRRILARRGATGVVYRDWPPRRGPATAGGVASALSDSAVARTWRSGMPYPLRSFAGFFKDAWRLSRELARDKPDLLFVHVNGSEAACLAGRWQLGDRVIGCYHLSVAPAPGGLLARSLDWIKKTVTMWSSTVALHPSRKVRDRWDRLCFYPAARTRIIGTGVDEESAEQPTSDPRRTLGISEDRFVFCVPVRLHPVKGLRYLLDAVAAGPETFGQAVVLVCGDGELREELEGFCARAGLSEIVRFLGWRPDVRAILRASDCAVLPSVASETTCLAIMEALMEGTPAIVTSVGGMAETVRCGVTGLVVPPASAPALRRAMLAVMADRSWARTLGHQARADARARLTRKRMLAEYARLLQEFCGPEAG